VTKEEKGKVEEIKKWMASDLGTDVEDAEFLLDLTHRLDVTCRLLAEGIIEQKYSAGDYGGCHFGLTCFFMGKEKEKHDPECLVSAAQAALEVEDD